MLMVKPAFLFMTYCPNMTTIYSSAMRKHLGKLQPAGAHIMSGLTCRVLDGGLWNTICDCSDMSYFQSLFHNSLPKVTVKSAVTSL